MIFLLLANVDHTNPQCLCFTNKPPGGWIRTIVWCTSRPGQVVMVLCASHRWRYGFKYQTWGFDDQTWWLIVIQWYGFILVIWVIDGYSPWRHWFDQDGWWVPWNPSPSDQFWGLTRTAQIPDTVRPKVMLLHRTKTYKNPAICGCHTLDGFCWHWQRLCSS